MKVIDMVGMFSSETALAIESQENVNDDLFVGTVGSYFDFEENWLDEKEVITASVYDDHLIIRVWGEKE